MMRDGIRLAVAVAMTPLAAGLLVAPGSPCSQYCGNTLDSTIDDELVCDAGSYDRSSAGTVFKGCIGCEMTSTYSSPNKQTDLQWLLCKRFPTLYDTRQHIRAITYSLLLQTTSDGMWKSACSVAGITHV